MTQSLRGIIPQLETVNYSAVTRSTSHYSITRSLGILLDIIILPKTADLTAERSTERAFGSLCHDFAANRNRRRI